MVVHLLGIRHHGPGSARSVVRALDELQPSVVLVESPVETTSAFSWVGDPGLEPPVALLGHVVDDPRRAAFAPLAAFSPEWQAVRWANEREVPVEAIDLPLANTLAVSLDDDELIDGGAPLDPLGALSAAAGEPDAERWWDDVIEHRGDGLPAFAAVSEAMAAVRSGTVPSTSELRREAHMRKCIRAALKAGHDQVVVVCGAWHVPALDVEARDVPNATTDATTLRGMAKAKVAVSWVPWTHERLAAATGYGAGVASPGWYDHVFRHPGRDGVARFFVDAARVLRDADMSASPDHLIAATRMADTLATMRGRPQPGLTEVLDAADSVMGGLPLVRRQLVVGQAIGSVPDDAPQVPLARDLARRQRSARLRPDTGDRRVELDLRTPNGRRRSHLLHQVAAIGVPWGTLEAGRGSSGTFRETWRLTWRPEWSVRVIEFAAFGTTVERAATARLIERAGAASSLVELADALDRALLSALPDAIDPVVHLLATRAANDPDTGQLMAALGPLAQARRYGDVRSTDASAMASVFDGLVVRVLAGVVPACASLDDDAAALMVERLSGMQQALALVDHAARERSFPRVLAQLSEGSGHGRVHGRATRILHDTGYWAVHQVEQRLGRALSAGTPPATGAAFVEGFLAGSGTVLVHDADLRSVVDRWLSSLTPQAFDETVPLLRRTFGAFESAERRQLGRLVAGAEREVVVGFGPGHDEARAAAALVTVRHLLGLSVPEAP
ncbi:DUF5682 family protein [Ilumatobacter sp.]|uniref:DUF5682 family protein n=1 Tax=Ilumatobacter sp. TaxID=1967498 RepID=UPI003AF9FBB9